MTRDEAMRWQEQLFPRGRVRMLPEICLDLRASADGTADPWPTERLAAVVAMLEARLDTWTESSSGMDEHVRGMVGKAVRMGLAELAHRDDARRDDVEARVA